MEALVVEIEKGLYTIDIGETLKKEIKSKFNPEIIEFFVRKSMPQLEHTRSFKDYVKEFTRLKLDISNMTEEDRIFSLNRLQP